MFHARYKVIQRLGTGGMGAVYEVVHTESNRRCVLKTMLDTVLTDPDMRARFKLEATIAADIESEHVVDVLAAGFDEGTGLSFLVMEHLRGENLAETIRRRGAMPANEVVALIYQASLALERTHAAGIVHRDLKLEDLAGVEKFCQEVGVTARCRSSAPGKSQRPATLAMIQAIFDESSP